ncbi:unnamed protein product [Acanthocheilonema viteae]|uniref:Uncharacterized protein n=1 Tax=Acanthocheilonema viteae TaxID=6277 RepID=A0A498SY01_ACAVI|nr:unnamed protein product [Acanthocheilonema viteae]
MFRKKLIFPEEMEAFEELKDDLLRIHATIKVFTEQIRVEAKTRCVLINDTLEKLNVKYFETLELFSKIEKLK